MGINIVTHFHLIQKAKVRYPLVCDAWSIIVTVLVRVSEKLNTEKRLRRILTPPQLWEWLHTTLFSFNILP